MFARTAKVLTVERQRAVRVQVRQTFSKVQDLDRLNAPRRRPILIRRWQLDPVSGKPVCAWEVESPDLPRGLGITPIRSMPEPQLLCIAVLPRQAAAASAFGPTRPTWPTDPVAPLRPSSTATGTPIGTNTERVAIRRGRHSRAD